MENQRIGPRAAHTAIALTVAASLSACATAPRSENATLAKSGLAATNTLAGDIDDISRRIRQASMQDTFMRTWTVCSNPKVTCGPTLADPAEIKARARLATTVAARARAVRALGSAYEALAAEAAYDARADASGAVGAAFETAQAYASLAGATVLPAVAAPIISYGAGLFADTAQAKRLRTNNRRLAQVVGQLHAGLVKEKAQFDSLAQAIVDQEELTRASLLESGLASSGQVLQPVIQSVGMSPVTDLDAVVARSVPARTSATALVQLGKADKLAVLQARYDASLKALDELKTQHEQAATDRPLNLTELNSRLAELDTLLAQIASN